MPDLDAPPSAYCVWQPITVDDSKTFSLEPMVAPWHPAGFSPDWATIKWLAYGANMHSARLARRTGADDALLLARGWGVADDGPRGEARDGRRARRADAAEANVEVVRDRPRLGSRLSSLHMHRNWRTWF